MPPLDSDDFEIHKLGESLEDLPENIELEPVLFLASVPPDYTITDEEKSLFEIELVKIVPAEELDSYKTIFQELEAYYPEGYFVVVKTSLKSQDEILKYKIIVESRLSIEDQSSTVNILVHEMSHGGKTSSYWIEDKAVSIPDERYLLFSLIPGKTIYEYIENPTTIDRVYLKDNDHTLFITLDEVNSYTKSTRLQREYLSRGEYACFACPDNPQSILARQLYFTTLHLKVMRENYPNIWNTLIKNKAFAFVLMRLVEMAEAEVNTSYSYGEGQKDLDTNLALYNQNKYIIDEYLQAAGVKDLDNLTYPMLLLRGVNFTYTKI